MNDSLLQWQEGARISRSILEDQQIATVMCQEVDRLRSTNDRNQIHTEQIDE